MIQPMPIPLQYNALIANIEQGLIKIPQFQRKFVWSIEQTAGLLDSIIKGYPIGSFILWETNEGLRSVRNIGDIHLPDTPEGQYVQYVLDGQQRMTSLYVSMKGVKIQDVDGKEVDYRQIYVDFTATADEPIVITDIRGKNPGDIIKVTDLLTGGFALAAKYPNYLDKLDKYSNTFKTYVFSGIKVTDAPIDIATEIFTRINVGGKALNVFEIMVAKTFDAKQGFDLSEKCDELLSRLEQVDYETISNTTVLQAVSVCMVKECSRKHILKLDKAEFIRNWEQVVSSFESAVDYLRTSYRIPVSQLLPYDGLLVPFTYFFYKHKNKPEGEMQKRLEDFFWRVVLTSRYSNALETKIAQDIKHIDTILSGNKPVYDEPVDITPEALGANGWFSTSTAYIKGMLCLLAYQRPLSFIDNAQVIINNGYLKQANSKNYHHFFPKAYMEKHAKDVEYRKVNHIANITIVDDFLNKRKIKAKAPSDYIRDFQAVNPKIQEALASHLIGDPEEWGITDNNYELFFRKRLEAMSLELASRLVLTPADRTMPHREEE